MPAPSKVAGLIYVQPLREPMQNVLPAFTPSLKNIYLLYSILPSPKRQQNFSSVDWFFFFLDYWARKIRHTYKNCQLENIVADSSELKTWSF